MKRPRSHQEIHRQPRGKPKTSMCNLLLENSMVKFASIRETSGISSVGSLGNSIVGVSHRDLGLLD